MFILQLFQTKMTYRDENMQYLKVVLNGKTVVYHRLIHKFSHLRGSVIFQIFNVRYSLKL